MPAANRGKQLRRLSPVTVYAALSELPRGAMNAEERRTKRDFCRLNAEIPLTIV